ncbi:MAG: hypothetical protein WBO31_09140 [Saprospiraceae bacterium]|nr:hypothetical protein [Saprospiraceae bacterium]
MKAQIVATKELLRSVEDHPLMSKNLRNRLNTLESELKKLPIEINEPKIQILFSGTAVADSVGIKTSFVSKTIQPLQEIIKTQIALQKFGKVGKRGTNKSENKTELYLTSLPTGSFGIELTQLKSNNLFDEIDASNAMKKVIHLLEDISKDDQTFENSIIETPRKSLNNLKSFLETVTKEHSTVKLECGELFVEISKENMESAFHRVSGLEHTDEPEFIKGILRGFLLNSFKFEIIDQEGKTITGVVNSEIDEHTLLEYDKNFLNKECQIHLIKHVTKFKTGNQKTINELLEIKPL